jgi:hypothetical protein
VQSVVKNSASNLELPLKIAAPAISPEQVDRVCEALRGCGWVTAAALGAVLQIDDRQIRTAAEYSDGRILSGPGCPGYRLLDSAARLGDADRAASCLESQARRMLHRAARIRSRMHRFAAGAKECSA